MTSRERLLAVLNNQIPDRVPISMYEISGYDTQAPENNDPSYNTLMDAVREKTDCVSMWDMRGNTSGGGAAKSAYPVKTGERKVKSGPRTDTFQTLYTPKGKLTASYRVYDHTRTNWTTEHLCKSPSDVDKLLSIPFEPLTYDAGDYARIRREAGSRGIIMSSVEDPAGAAMQCLDFADAMVWAMTETAHFSRVLDEFHRRNMINLENMLKTQAVELYRICGPELLTPPYLPPEYFKRFVTPYLRDMTGLIHRYGGLARVHCHGNIRAVLDEIISVGADALDPCEAPPDGDICLRELKQRTAGKLCLFGNLQPKLMEWGKTEEVREAVRRCMEAAKDSGGYVIMPTAAPINMPLPPRAEENYLVFFETALEYGRY